MKVLITGIGGALARRVTLQLRELGHTIIGIDRRPWPDAPKDVSVFKVDVRKRPAEDVFRVHRPDAVIHMATVTYISAQREERYRINLGGTRAVWKHCETYGVQSAIFVGRHTVYGAAADAPLFRTEDEPLYGGTTFPNLADLVSADLFAGNALWRIPTLKTAVLRMAYTLGPSNRGTLANFLRGPRVPLVLGFDPLFQFIHEYDAARAIVATLQAGLVGVYNVAGPQPVPLSVLTRITGRTPVAIPEPIFPIMLGRFGLPRLPRASVNHIKYPVVIDCQAFQQAAQYLHAFDETETMQSFRWS
ncbi:MAG: NAD-dependent epimerase/dehydratase family protein [Myxococcota bacterium]|nr:NAD-dependent epimerase/dehydratase family protein [Myxococcota bacterium]